MAASPRMADPPGHDRVRGRRLVGAARTGFVLVMTGLAVACGRIGYDPTTLAGDPDADASDVLDGLLARYTFDSELTRDSTGGHDAMCEDGCPGVDPAGFSGAALSMNGGPTHLRVGDDGTFRTEQGFTVTGWVRYRKIEARTCIMTKPIAGSSNSWALCTEVNQRPFFFACDTCDMVFSPIAVDVDVWVHLAGSYDGAVKRLYVDGTEVAQAPGQVTFNATAIVIGGDIDGAFGFATNGLIDDLRIYGRALDAAEIAAVAAASAGDG